MEIRNTTSVRMRAVVSKVQSGDFDPHHLCFPPAVTALLALGVSIFIILCFIYFPISKVAHIRHCRLPTERALLSGVFCVFIHHSAPPFPTLPGYCRLHLMLLGQYVLVVFSLL